MKKRWKIGIKKVNAYPNEDEDPLDGKKKKIIDILNKEILILNLRTDAKSTLSL